MRIQVTIKDGTGGLILHEVDTHDIPELRIAKLIDEPGLAGLRRDPAAAMRPHRKRAGQRPALADPFVRMPGRYALATPLLRAASATAAATAGATRLSKAPGMM